MKSGSFSLRMVAILPLPPYERYFITYGMVVVTMNHADLVDNLPGEEIHEGQSEFPSEKSTKGSKDFVGTSDSADRSKDSATLLVEINGRKLPLTSAIEVLLFVSDDSVEVASLAKALDVSSEAVYGVLHSLNSRYAQHESGLRVQEHKGRFQLVTHSQFAQLIEEYLSLELTTKLSAPALETLAIVAYRQPVTRAQIEAVRGVDSSGILRSLVQRGLIEESGRLEGVGRPILYTVTEEFMHHFGLTGLDELPQLETTEADTLWAATKLAELEESSENNP